METPSRNSFTLDGATRVFPIPSNIKGDNYARLEVDGVIINDRAKYDIVNNSIVFISLTDVPAGSQLDVLVVQSEEAIGQLAITTNIDIVAQNIANVNLTGSDITSVNTTATNIASVVTNATNIASINTNAANIVAIQGASANADAAAADLVLTNADVVLTNADVVSTNADVISAAASAAAAIVAKIEWQGAYNPVTAYALNDAVSYVGASYINIQAGTGQLPVVGGTAYWDELAVRGIDGDALLDAIVISAKVNEAAGISNGQVVYISGATGGFPQVSIASNASFSKSDVLAIAKETKSNNQVILVTTVGLLENIDTSAFAEGDVLYLGIDGAMTATHPTGITPVQRIGHAVKINASTGSIIVELDALTIINDHNGTMRQQIVNQNAGAFASTTYTMVNDASHRSSLSYLGSGWGAGNEHLGVYNEGYGKTIFTVDGNHGFEWNTDVTDSHDFSNTTKMSLSAAGVLTVGTMNLLAGVTTDVEVLSSDILTPDLALESLKTRSVVGNVTINVPVGGNGKCAIRLDIDGTDRTVTLGTNVLAVGTIPTLTASATFIAVVTRFSATSATVQIKAAV